MEAKSAAEAEMWVKSIELVMSKSEEYLNLDRYVDEKVFSKITGKSLFKDYETILEEYRKKLWEEELRKRKIEEEKRIEEERKKLEEMGKKKANKVAAKKEVPDVDLKKVKSEFPPAKAVESIPVLSEDKTPIRPIEHKSTLKNDTIKTQPIEETKWPEPEPILFNVKSEKIELVKKDFTPVNNEDKTKNTVSESSNSRKELPQLEKKESGNISRVDSGKISQVEVEKAIRIDSAAIPKEPPSKIEFSVPVTTNDDYNFDLNPNKNKKPIKETQPLLLNENSDDEEDDNFKGFGINQSSKSTSKNKIEENSKDEISEEIANLIHLDNQRKESMYDLVMK